jgi:hypothetical protein
VTTLNKFKGRGNTHHRISCTELLGLFWTLSIVWYVEDKRPQRFGDRSSLRNVVVFCLLHTRRWLESKISPIVLYNKHHRQNPFKSTSDICWSVQFCTLLQVPIRLYGDSIKVSLAVAAFPGILVIKSYFPELCVGTVTVHYN